MPSTNKLASARVKSRNRLAKFLLSFCGIASFGVFTILTSTNTNALSTVSNQVSVTIPGSIALRLLDSTATTEIDSLSFNLTPTASGTALTKRTIVDVATSNPTGYKLYMQSNYQKSGNYTTDLIHQDAQVSDSIPTSTSASTLYWNYNNPLTSTTNPIPAHGTPDKIGQRLDAPTNSDQIPIDINVSVDTSIVAGTYENQLLFSAVGNPTTVNYTITFNMAGGEPQIPKIEERSAAGVYSTTIPNTMPMKSGLMFDHWEVQSAAPYTTTAKCNNTTSCVPGDTIIVHSDEVEFKGDITLKAIYRQVFSGITNMQQMTPAICSAASTGDTTILSDTRDSNTYTVKKLLDGRCWMTQNLRLTGPQNLTPANSNVRTNWSLPTQTSESDDGSTAGANKWCTEQNQECIDRAVNLNTNNYDYGTYYTWNAATAGTGTYDITSGNTDSSICPKGWRLPTGASGGEFQVLYNYYNSYDSVLDSNGPAYVLAGLRSGNKTSQQGTRVLYWASTTNSNISAFDLDLISEDQSVHPADRSNRYRGFSVRCIAAQEYTLTVNPNGGTWSGSTDTQYFDQEPSTTKNIPNPTATPTYTISYNDNGQGATYTGTPTSVSRPFTSWATSGEGTLVNGMYTFGEGDGSLLAQYSTTSNTFILPEITKSGNYMGCKWAEGSPSGTQYYAGDTRTVSGNTTYYAVCGTITKMQEMTNSICQNTAGGATATLTDTRDGKGYLVYKVSNSYENNCWMTSNLDLEGPRDITSADSDVLVGSSFRLPASNSGAWCSGESASCINQPYADRISNPSSMYYNWYALTAGTGTYELADGSKASSSICPKGWKLPDTPEILNAARYGILAGDYNLIPYSYRQPSGGVYPNAISYKRTIFASGQSSDTGNSYFCALYMYSRTETHGVIQMCGKNQYSFKHNGYVARCLAK